MFRAVLRISAVVPKIVNDVKLRPLGQPCTVGILDGATVARHRELEGASSRANKMY